MTPSIEQDLDFVLRRTERLWNGVRAGRLLIAGGTGFLGSWLVETVLAANRRYGLELELTVLTRNPEAFLAKMPHFARDPALRLHRGDVRTFDFPPGTFQRLIHVASETDPRLHRPDPLRTLDTIVSGTRRVLDFGLSARVEKLLFISSGHVYGNGQPGHVSEDFPARVNSAYGEGKKWAEELCGEYAARYGIDVRLARCFNLIGPYLPLNAAYAPARFIRGAVEEQLVHCPADGAPVQSYMFAAEAVVWLWTILELGATGRPYHVGSEEPVSLSDLARMVAEECGVDVRPLGGSEPSDDCSWSDDPCWFVPSTARAQEELGLRTEVPLKYALQRTLDWARSACLVG